MLQVKKNTFQIQYIDMNFRQRVYEKDIRALSRQMNFPTMGKCCPADGETKREYMKDLIQNLRKDIPKVRENLIGAIKRSNIPGWELPKKN